MKSEVLKSISLLTSGTIVAQLIPLLAAPLIARLFTADEFGEFAAVMAIVKVMSIVVNGRYEMAVVLPKKASSAMALIIGTWGIGIIVISVFVLFSIFSLPQISSWINFDLNLGHLLLVIVALIGLGLWQPINYYFIRTKSYMKMTYNKFVKSISLVAVTLFFGYYSDFFQINGLILGFSVGWVILAIFSLYQFDLKELIKTNLSRRLIKFNLAKYSEYPKYNALPALLNNVASQMGIYVFIFFFSTEISGHYSFARQYLYVPMSILGMSLSQVYFQRMSEKFRNSQSIYKELSMLLAALVFMSLIISSIVFFYSNEIFEVVFGGQWNVSANISKLLIFAFCAQFIVSPLSMVLHALNRVKLASVFPVVYILIMSSLFTFNIEKLDQLVNYYVLAEIIPYVLYFVLIAVAVIQYEKGLINKHTV